MYVSHNGLEVSIFPSLPPKYCFQAEPPEEIEIQKRRSLVSEQVTDAEKDSGCVPVDSSPASSFQGDVRRHIQMHAHAQMVLIDTFTIPASSTHRINTVWPFPGSSHSPNNYF